MTAYDATATRLPRAGEPPARFPITREAFHRMDELGLFKDQRVELIDGEIIVMAPMGFRHAFPIQELNWLIARALPEEFRLRPQLPLEIDELNEPQPDLAVVRRADTVGGNPGRALLAIEVGVSSVTFDLKRKAPLYARARVPEYWVLDVMGRVVVVHRAPAAGRYRSVKRLLDLSSVQSSAVPGLLLDLRSVLPPRR